MAAKLNLPDLNIDELKRLVGDAQKEIERKEKSKIRDVRSQMEKLAGDVGMTPEQILSYDKKSKKPSKPGVPKYRNPENPKQTWTGRGKRPKWFMDAQAKGVTPEEMEIN